MLRHNLEEHNNEQDEVELSRRSFFGRFAVGAVLSIAMPGVVHAAKSKAVKADKNQRLAKAGKTAVRLPKHPAIQASKAEHKSTKTSIGHAKGKEQKLFASKHGKINKAAASEHKTLHTAHHGHHNSRVRNVYASNNHGHRNGRAHSIIEPVQREPFIESAQEPMFLSDYSRLTGHRSLAIQNPHTGDKLSLTYFEKGRYLNDALDEISFLLRDYRTGDVHPVDPELLDQLHDLKQMMGLIQPFDVICGYRSPLTNARLHAEHSGVANNSFHIHGRAVDIRIERLDIRRIRNAAVAMHRGGVGYYPGSNFIHLDTGSFRTWTL